MKNKIPKDSIFKRKGFYTALYSCMGVVMVVAAVVSYNNLSNRDMPGGEGQAQVDFSQMNPASSSETKPGDYLAQAGPDDEFDDDVETFIKLPGRSASSPAPAKAPAGATPPPAAVPTPAPRPAAPVTPAPAQTPAPAPAPAPVQPAQGGRSSEADDEGEIGAALEPVEDSTADEMIVKPDAEVYIKTQDLAIDMDQAVFSPFDGRTKMDWPIFGEIVMDYSDEHVIYDQTLDQYRTNDVLCIQADVGTQVRASADGVVTQVTKTREDGNTVVIDNGNGWKTVYTQLQDGVLVREGDVVRQGQVIGGVGYPSIYSVLLGSHVGFKVTNNGTAVDPRYVLGQ